MKKQIIPVAAGLMIASLAFFSGCRKNDREEDNDTTSARDNAIAEAAFNDVFKQVDEMASVQADVNRSSDPSVFASPQLQCATITVNPALPNPAFPKTVTIDFGPVNCTGTDGVNRRGQIIATFSGRYRDSATVISITTNNYYVNDYKVQGTKTVTNRGHNPAGNLWYDVNVSNAVVTNPQGQTVSWNSQRVREWIQGESTTGNVLDDVYLITGTANGTGVHGNSFTVTITQALRVEIGCRYIVSGKLDLVPQNVATRSVDFGSGACDNQATVTINGNSYPITLQ